MYTLVSINALQLWWRFYLCWIYHGTGITLALGKQEVSLHHCRVRVHLTSKMFLMLLDASHFLMRSYVISPSCAILLSKSIIRYNCDDGSALLDWPSLVECMDRLWSCWALTSRRYVCSYSMQHEVVCNFTLMCYFGVQIDNTLQWRWRVCVVAWLTFVGWMYGPVVIVLGLDE